MENLNILFTLFPWSLIAGVMISAICSALGVYVILKRMVFIGIALSEAAALGIACGMIFGIPTFATSSVLTLAFGLGLSRPYENGRLPREAILGVLFSTAGALSILLVSKAGLGLEEIKALLYGDLILTRLSDLTIGLTVFAPVVILLLLFRRPILYTFLDRESARILGISVAFWELVYFASLSLVVAASARVAGAMLVFAYLIIAPSAALLASRRLRVVVPLSIGISVVCTLAGIYGALALDLPANQLIVALLAASIAMVWMFRIRSFNRPCRYRAALPAGTESSPE